MGSQNSEKRKLLLVDDREENLIALNAVLQRDYELIECLSGSEALLKVEQHDFTAILLDVQMPEMDGFETAALIRKTKRSETTPIIFITAIHRTDENEFKGYIAGAVDFLFKPFSPDVLKAKLNVFSELQRQSEELRKQAVKEKENQLLWKMLETRDEFLSMAAHELKTPITPLTLQMQSFMKMLKNDTLHDAPKQVLMKMLETSYDQVERLGRTVDELLDVSRFVTGKFALNPDVCSLGDLASKILQGYEEQLRAAGIEYDADIENNVIGEWDCFRMEQVLINLLSNAIRYGKGRPIEVRVAKDKDGAVLEVKDYGIGINIDDQARIFQRFERAASPKHYGGLGLGLYIASEIVHRHAGSISVESEIDKGSTFRVWLPIRSPERLAQL